MIKNPKKSLTRSNKHGNHRSGKSTGKRRQSALTKSKNRIVGSGRNRPKPSVKAIPQATHKLTKPAQRRVIKTPKPVSAAKRKSTTPQEKELERGRRLKELHQKGHSLAELGRKIGGSKSLARDLVALAKLSKDLEEAYVQGKIGRKAALKMARDRGSAVKKNPPVPIQQPQPKQNPVPAMTEEERERKISEGAALVVEWLRMTGLAPCDVEMFFSQVNSAMYGALPWLFASEAPKPDEIKPDENPWEVIKRCKVEREKSKFVTDTINDLVTWLARWIQRVIPDRAMMEDAIDQARRQLLREARNAHCF